MILRLFFVLKYFKFIVRNFFLVQYCFNNVSYKNREFWGPSKTLFKFFLVFLKRDFKNITEEISQFSYCLITNFCYFSSFLLIVAAKQKAKGQKTFLFGKSHETWMGRRHCNGLLLYFIRQFRFFLFNFSKISPKINIFNKSNIKYLIPLIGSLCAWYIFTLFMFDCQYFTYPLWSPVTIHWSLCDQTIVRTGTSWA